MALVDPLSRNLLGHDPDDRERDLRAPLESLRRRDPGRVS
jgi:hypothetical protein